MACVQKRLNLILVLYILNLFNTTDGLQCQDIENDVQIDKELSSGRVKGLYSGFYKDIPVVLSYPADLEMRDDFKHGLQMLIDFQESGFVTELVGYCLDIQNLKMVTKYHKHGSLVNLDQILEEFTSEEAWNKRLQLAVDYLSIIEFLHEKSRVMCDSSDLTKTLSQYLITDDFRLVVNDLDALPSVSNNQMIKCGHRQLFGEFVAPEQLWPHDDRPFLDEEMIGYDEKTDIWKMPNVLLFLLGRSALATRTKVLLFELFGQCKNIEPAKRPSAKEVKQKFKDVLEGIRLKIEL
eukprot:TCONS_00068782-protein